MLAEDAKSAADHSEGALDMRARAARMGVRLGASVALLLAAVSARAAVTGPGPVGADGPANAALTIAQGFAAVGPVDVLLDGRVCAVRSVPYGAVAPRLSVPAGSHTFSVRPADGRCTGGADLVAGTMNTAAGTDSLLVVRPSGGGAGLTARPIDLSAVATYRARLRVHNDTSAATVTATIARVSSPASPHVEVVGLAAGQASGAQQVVRGSDYRIEVATEWGTLSLPLDVVEHWVFDVHVMGSGPGDLRLVVHRAPAANAEL